MDSVATTGGMRPSFLVSRWTRSPGWRCSSRRIGRPVGRSKLASRFSWWRTSTRCTVEAGSCTRAAMRAGPSRSRRRNLRMRCWSRAGVRLGLWAGTLAGRPGRPGRAAGSGPTSGRQWSGRCPSRGRCGRSTVAGGRRSVRPGSASPRGQPGVSVGHEASSERGAVS